MEYKVEVVINKPIEEVLRLITDSNNLKSWQPGLVSFETLEGEPSKAGSKSKLVIKQGGRTMEMIENVTTMNFQPDYSGINEYSSTFEAKGVFNIVKNYFERIDENTTKFTSANVFEFHSLPMKIFAAVLPGIFKKETLSLMENFKNFAEGNVKNAE